MTCDKPSELPTRSAADKSSPVNGADMWRDMQQLTRDEKKFFNDVNNALVSGSHLPSLAITDATEHAKNKNEHCDARGQHHGHHRQGDWKDHRDGVNGEPKHHRESASDASDSESTNKNFSPDETKKLLKRDIDDISADLKKMMPEGPWADRIIEGFQHLASQAISGMDNSPSGTGSDRPPLPPTSGAGSDSSPGSTTSGSGSDASSGSTSSGSGSDVSAGSTTSGSGSEAPPPPPSDTDNGVINANGKFAVKNGRIYDPSGREFIPNGINVDSHQALAQIDMLTNRDHFNFMRIGFNGMVNKDGSPNFANLDAIEKAYSKKGIPVEFEYPIKDDQSVLTGDSLTKAENWYSQVAAHYKDNPYVWLATPNESGDGTTNNSGWLAQTKGILSAIEKTGNTNPIVVDDTHWSGAAVQGDPTKSGLIQNAKALHDIAPNLVAAEHDYASTAPSVSANNLSRGIDALKAAGYAPFIQEFGPYNFGNDHPAYAGSGADAVLSKATMEAGVGYNAYVDTYGYSPDVVTAVAGPKNQDVIYNSDGSLTDWGKKLVAQNEADQNYTKNLT